MIIPKRIRIGGQVLEVSQPKELDGKLGKCSLGNGFIKIADTFDGMSQSESSKLNTFWHETVHCILDTMGRGDLSVDETFVCSFAGFLTECVCSMEESDSEHTDADDCLLKAELHKDG